MTTATAEPTAAEIEAKTIAAVEKVKKMCRDAFEAGVKMGYQKGFEAGVVAATDPQPRIIHA